MFVNTSKHYFHTSVCHGNKPAKALRKVMGFSKSKKRIYSEASPVMPTASTFSKGINEGKHSGNARRASVLNKTFMRYITDLMATGENSNEFLGHGIEISQVQVTPDFKGLNVLWIAKGDNNDDNVETILQKNAGYLRHELSRLKVMGVVPKIQFVKDKKNAIIAEIDRKLAQADFGDDYQPLELETQLKTQLELYQPLEPHICKQIEDLQGNEGEEETLEVNLPPMPQDVFGLNHADILNRINKSIRKSTALHRKESNENGNEEESRVSTQFNDDPIQYSSNKAQRLAFKEFLAKREIQRYKSRQIDKNYSPDIEYIREEFKERRNEFFKNLDIYDTYNDEKDYLIEEEQEDDGVDGKS